MRNRNLEGSISINSRFVEWAATKLCDIRYVFVADISPLLIKFTDKGNIIQHDVLSGHLPWGEFLWGDAGIDAKFEDATCITDTGTVEHHLNILVFDARFAGFIGVGKLKPVRTGRATIAKMTSRGLAITIYAV